MARMSFLFNGDTDGGTDRHRDAGQEKWCRRARRDAAGDVVVQMSVNGVLNNPKINDQLVRNGHKATHVKLPRFYDAHVATY